jgi:membrane-associated protease RseP (regulator of RpoE activity)
MQGMDNTPNHDEDYNSDIIRAEIVDEMEPGAPWEWHEVRPVRRQRRIRLPLLLFIATCLSTLWAGMAFWADWRPGWFAALLDGLSYAVPVMTILICHEMGHFIQAHRYGVYASFPYFLPMPLTPLGTLGAVIAMEPRMGHRKALFDIGITGPLAGLVPTFIFLVIGLRQSDTAFPPRGAALFGDPLLFQILANKILGPIPAGMEVIPSPMAFAGWVGLLVTSLNLIPIGQLDGGHVLYALLRDKANRVASFLLLLAIVLVALDFRNYGSWTIMLILLLLMGPVHPPTADDEEPLGIVRTVLGWLTLAFIILGFTPTPMKYMP